MKTLTETEARQRRLWPLTTGYRPDEAWMLENVIHDLRTCPRRHALVTNREGLDEVWIEPIPGFADLGDLETGDRKWTGARASCPLRSEPALPAAN